MEALQCCLLHLAYGECQAALEEERRRLLSLPFADERELRRALRGIELQQAALATTFHREHAVGEDGDERS